MDVSLNMLFVSTNFILALQFFRSVDQSHQHQYNLGTIIKSEHLHGSMAEADITAMTSAPVSPFSTIMRGSDSAPSADKCDDDKELSNSAAHDACNDGSRQMLSSSNSSKVLLFRIEAQIEPKYYKINNETK